MDFKKRYKDFIDTFRSPESKRDREIQNIHRLENVSKMLEKWIKTKCNTTIGMENFLMNLEECGIKYNDIKFDQSVSEKGVGRIPSKYWPYLTIIFRFDMRCAEKFFRLIWDPKIYLTPPSEYEVKRLAKVKQFRKSYEEDNNL
jgi:hypothetical protein